MVTRLNGPQFGVNPDLLERIEETPDTVLTLVDGTKFIVSESAAEVVTRVVNFRARVVACAQHFAASGAAAPAADGAEPHAGGLAPAVPLRRKGGPDGSR